MSSTEFGVLSWHSLYGLSRVFAWTSSCSLFSVTLLQKVFHFDSTVSPVFLFKCHFVSLCHYHLNASDFFFSFSSSRYCTFRINTCTFAALNELFRKGFIYCRSRHCILYRTLCYYSLSSFLQATEYPFSTAASSSDIVRRHLTLRHTLLC